jgi:flagellin
MSIVVGSNIFSLRAQTELAKTSASLGRVYERLSSGLRINSASDDPAGLMVADRLRSESALLAVASRNANDGITLAAIADSSLEEIGSILSRMGELANQAANSVYTNVQRSAMATEFLALGSEVERIAQVTTFNGINLLSNSSTITLQVGITGTTNSQITIGAVLGTLSSLGLGNAGGVLSYTLLGTTTDAAVTASRLALTALTTAVDNVSASRGVIGAAKSRLQYSVNYLAVARQNTIAAESAIRDADVASEIAELTRLQVLQQAQTAILAQANQQPATVLKLLS